MIIYYRIKSTNIFNIRLSTVLCFKKSLLDLRIKTVYIKVFGIFNGFKLKLEIKSGKLEK